MTSTQKWGQTTPTDKSSWENIELASRTRMESYSLSSAPSTTWSWEAPCSSTSRSTRRHVHHQIGGLRTKSITSLSGESGGETCWTSDSNEEQTQPRTITWLVADLKVKLNVYRDRADRASHKYNVHSLKEKTMAEVYQCELRNRFSALAHQPEESVEET